ncbi:TMV resistance protein N [Artemisia annua]|uniref:TMV resistance protein N n=1 Tax=Artemisia annua TaxID=35608 RepID=A0A2U1NSU1_ARTAN|nr:TMV resistance protein N [Artemisia annua]
MSKDRIVKVLQDEDFFPDVEIQIQNLVHKFLVKYEQEMLFLHDVIEKMGQEVVRRENEDEPGKRTRLTGYGDMVHHVLGDCLGTYSVRSIRFYSYEKKERVTVQLDAFKKMSNLRFIQLNHLNLKWSSSSNDDISACFSFKHLKYLEWDRVSRIQVVCNPRVMKATSRSPDASTVAVAKNRWRWPEVMSLKKLKILDVDNSNSLTKTGNFTGLENLEELSFYNCKKLEELDSSIGCLQKLVELDLSYCSRLKRLPWEMIGKLTSLQNLYLQNCSNILEISHDLSMRNCNVSQVSGRIGNLVSLEILDLSGNRFSSLPESFSNLSKLKELYINDCSQLQILPPLPSQLTDIQATKCGSLDLMPFDSLQKAYIFHSKAFKESRLMNNDGLLITLSWKELPGWCTYGNSGNVLSFEALIQFDSKICGLILCATIEEDYIPSLWGFLAIYNKTKGTSHRFRDCSYGSASMLVMFYPLNDTTLVVEAGDTVEVKFTDTTLVVDIVEQIFYDEKSVKSCGLRLIYEDDVVDSGLVLKDARKPALSLFPLSSEIMTGNSITELNDEDV